MYSETVREPQLVITTPDPCGHFEATVTPMCGSITGAQTSPVKLGGELYYFNQPTNKPVCIKL